MQRAAVFIDGHYLSMVLKEGFGAQRIDYEKFSDLLVSRIGAITLSSTAEWGAGGETQGDRAARPLVWRAKTYVYDSLPYLGENPSPEEEARHDGRKKFLLALDALPRFQFRGGKAKVRGTHPDGAPRLEQKRVDVMLAVDLVRSVLERQFEFVVLVAADSDFVPAVQAARAAGATVILYHGRARDLEVRDFDELRQNCDESYPITHKIVDACRRG